MEKINNSEIDKVVETIENQQEDLNAIVAAGSEGFEYQPNTDINPKIIIPADYYPDVSLIVAMSKNNVIGIYDNLPWRNLKTDMAHFKKTTTDNIIIVGRTTWETFGRRPLPNRDTIILTTGAGFDLFPEGEHHPSYKNCYVAHNIHQAIDIANDINVLNNKKIFVIGGAQIYNEYLNNSKYVNTLIITKVDLLVNGENPGNVYFPDYVEADWLLESSEKYMRDDKNEHNFSIDIFKRAPKTLKPDNPA